MTIAVDLGHKATKQTSGPRSAVSFMSDCRSMGRKFDPGLVPYFRGD